MSSQATFQNIISSTQQQLELQFKHPLEEKLSLIIVGLSGGPDSVFLLHIFHELAQQNLIQLAAAHLDHGWRENSAYDATWCKQLCEKLGVALYAEHAKNLSLPKNLGSQEALGRALRRAFFKKLTQQLDADLVALGHHSDDQQETFFLRLMRGSSLNGLRCMDRFSGIYFRPLLNVKKTFILEYLNQNKIEYLTDYTNTSDTYLRNRIRNTVIPALRSCDKRFDEKFASTLERLQEEDAFLQEITLQKFNEIFTDNTQIGQLSGNLTLFRTTHPVLQKRVLVLWLVQSQASFTPQHSFLLEIIKFLTSCRGGAHRLHDTWLIKKEGKRFWLINTL